MEAVVVLELDLSKVEKLLEKGRAAQAGGGSRGGVANFLKRTGFDQAVQGGEVRLPGMQPPKEGPGSSKMPMNKGNAAKAGAAAAIVAIIAMKVVEEVMEFGSKMLQNSKVLNSYMGAMGKTLSAAVDVLMLPFQPILNMMLLGMTKLLAWMVANEIPAKLYAGAVAIWKGLEAFFAWTQKVFGFFNHSLNPMNWDWGALFSAIGGIIADFFKFLGKQIERLIDWASGIAKSVAGWLADQAKDKGGGFLDLAGSVTGLTGNPVAGIGNALIPGGSPIPNWGASDVVGGAMQAAHVPGGNAVRTFTPSKAAPTVINLTQEIVTADPITAGRVAAETINQLGPGALSGLLPVGGH